jgi:signal transduction histidine kinase
MQLGSMVTVPMRARGELLGALTVCFGKSGRHHTSDDVKLAEELARRGSVAILQARLYERAQTAAAEAEEASRVKDEFLATVSHELRTPLNAILGWAAILRDQMPAGPSAKGVEVIHRNAHAQAKIIDDILDVSRIITGKFRLELARADLVEIVRDGIEVVRPSAVAKGISIELAPPADDYVVVVDAERLQQVMWNVLSNAVKFTDAGGTVRIALQREPSNLVVSVTDTGKGIDPAFLPHVFDPFKQADGSTTRRVGGLGLGLAIVRHIVQLHGGEVRARSAGLGAGSTFAIALPIRAVAPTVQEPERSSVASSEPRRESSPLVGLKLLVVDDEPDARELLRVVLEQAGAQVTTAASASEAFGLLEHVRPHVLISDIGMPGEDGYGFMRRIRTLGHASGGGIPSIALTAYTRAEDKMKALSAGFTTHIGKPVDANELRAAVANLGRLAPRQGE